MTKSTLPLLALILSMISHAGNDPFLNPVKCQFDLISRQQRAGQIFSSKLWRHQTNPVRLLQPTGPRRYGTGLVVELKTGEKVVAISNAMSSTPEMMWELLKQKYSGQTLRPLWSGQVEIEKPKNEDDQVETGKPKDENKLARIVRVTTLPVTLKQSSGQKPEADNNVEHLVAALTAIHPDLVDPVSVKASGIVSPEQPPNQLAPFVSNPRAVSEVLQPMQEILLSCLKDANGAATTTVQFGDLLKSKAKAFTAHKDQLTSVLQAFENDGLINSDKVDEIELLYSEVLSPDAKPNRFLGDSLYDELSSLQDKLHYVESNPAEHVEIIEPGTIIRATDNSSPAE